jgi:hypothetical protein
MGCRHALLGGAGRTEMGVPAPLVEASAGDSMAA